ncbi:uncharacterized protein LOC126850903 isoform X2 [Cataglyphis hispanica]|uniref:uncharacterized protein LOC126850903 isoform X2 n=1 Tax=Cataglyphis hispanica TaxID=1086592 RepID=UPI00217F8818|nr:uncharacterized protein LOC126850903 isoform X2 [Cataglyphis hispanica]
MLIREFALMALLFLPTLSDNDCQWCHAIEFWSSVICSMENSKTVHFHSVLDDNSNSIHLESCFEAFVHSIARKCAIATMLRTYTFPDPENTSFVDDNDVIYEIVKQPSIWKITSDDELPFQVTSAKIKRIIRNSKAFGENTWNVHVILPKNIRSFDQISKDDSTFEWKPHDRFIVLIACREKVLNKSRLDGILKTLWTKRKVQSILVAETIAVNDTKTDRAIRSYNPFAKVNDSAYGQVEIIQIKTAEEASNLLSHLTYHRTNNMNGYELKTGLFSPTEETASEQAKVGLNNRDNNTDIFEGLDETILDTISQRMNFTARWIHPTDNKLFGHQLSNGTYVGAIGDVVNGRTDICFESFFIKKYSNNIEEDINFSVYMDFDRICVIVPKATKIPKGLRLYYFFPRSVWICSILTQIFVYLMWYFLQIFIPRRTGKINVWKMIYRLILLDVGCPQKLPNTNAERILLSGILLANITMTGFFSGILYNSFAHDMYYPDINTLRELDASGLVIALASISLTDLFDDDNSSTVMRNLRSKLRYGENAVVNAAYYRNGSGFAKENYFPAFSAQFVDVDGGPLLHLVKECPGAFFLSYLLPKNSILQEGINEWISRLNQGGLTLLWSKQNIESIKKELTKRTTLTTNEKQMSDFVPFNLSDVQSSFYMLLTGQLISAIIFFHEKGWLKGRSLSRPSRDQTRNLRASHQR